MADAGHKETDKVLSQLEKKLKTTYRTAARNAQSRFTQYMADFSRKDAEHKAEVASGKWTQEQYENWRKNQLLYADTLKQIKQTIASDLQNTDKIAIQMIRDKQPDVYAINYNYGTYEIEKGAGVDTTFTLYDHDTVERLMKDDPKLLPKPSKKRQAEIDASDLKWNMDKLTSAFTSSILSGDDIATMAKRISGVAAMDWKAAVRNARTMTTGAENAGRSNAYKRAQGMGIDVMQEWVATLDGRTRDSHRAVDGEKIKIGGRFSNGLRYPGDPDGPGYEVYNCRCTTVAVVNGVDPMAFDKTDTLRRKLENQDITYEEWKKGRKFEQTCREIRNGGNISYTTVQRLFNGEVSRKDVLKAVSGIGDNIAEECVDSVESWSGGAYKLVRKFQNSSVKTATEKRLGRFYSNRVESVITKSPAWKGGTTHRGISVSDEEFENIKSYAGTIKPYSMKGTASWSSSYDVAVDFAKKSTGTKHVIFHCETQERGTTIMPYSITPWEYEVLVSRKANYLVKSTSEDKDGLVHVFLEEI